MSRLSPESSLGSGWRVSSVSACVSIKSSCHKTVTQVRFKGQAPKVPFIILDLLVWHRRRFSDLSYQIPEKFLRYVKDSLNIFKES